MKGEGWPLPEPPRGAKSLAAFLLVAYGAAYALDYLAVLPLLSRGDPITAAAATPLLALRMLLPGLGATAALLAAGRSPRELLAAFPLSGARRWLPLSVAAPLTAYTLSVPLAIALGADPGPCGFLATMGEALGPGFLAATVLGIIALGVAAGATINAVFAAGEEAGWRWYLLGLLAPRLGVAPSGLLVGVAWALWHAPLVAAGYNYSVQDLEGCGEPSQGLPALAAFTAYAASLSLLLSLLAAHTGTTASAAVAHGTVNAVGGLYAMLVVGPRTIAPPAGLAAAASTLMIAAALAALALARKTREGLGGLASPEAPGSHGARRG